MSRSPRLQVVPDGLGEAKAAHARAQAATTAALAALDEREAERVAAVAAYDVTDSDSAADAAARAQLARDKAERVLGKRQAEEGEALDALRVLARADDERELEGAIAFVEAMPARLLPAIAQLELLREALWKAREELADEVVRTQGIHDHAAALGAKLGNPADLTRRAARPTILDAQLLVRAALALADRRAARDSCNGWLDAEGIEDQQFNSPRSLAVQAATETIQKAKGAK
jgi:hypothetical protein